MVIYFSGSSGSSDTSSYTSDSQDDEEIQLAVKAAAVASKKEIRSRFHSSSDLIHRLFVCISGRTLDTILIDM